MPLRFVFALHNHQPVGNFDHVFENAFRDSYWPFLEHLEQYPEIPIALHRWIWPRLPPFTPLAALRRPHPSSVSVVKPVVPSPRCGHLGEPKRKSKKQLASELVL